MRRLTQAGLVADTGERSPGGRGCDRVGSYYALAADIGTALPVSIAPEGVVAESVDAHGETVTRAEENLSEQARSEQVAAALRTAVAKIGRETGLAAWLAVMSAADPVDRTTSRLVYLPDAPFRLGDLPQSRRWTTSPTSSSARASAPRSSAKATSPRTGRRDRPPHHHRAVRPGHAPHRRVRCPFTGSERDTPACAGG